MQPSPQSAPASLQKSSAIALPARKPEDLAYQAVTVAAILLVITTMWVF